MSELVAFVFRDQFRAPEVLNELRRRDWSWVKDLDEAVAITLNEEGKARVHLSINLNSCEDAGWARIWGAFLNTTLFQPLTEVVADAANGYALASSETAIRTKQNGALSESEWWRKSLENSDNFRRDIAALMLPNGSAIFILFRAQNTPVVLKQLHDYGDTIVHTTLSPEQDEKLVEMLATCRGGRTQTPSVERRSLQ